MSITQTEPNKGSTVQEATTAYRKRRNSQNRRENFSRNPSLQKIIKFNAYICSQNYFLLPSILTWLKTSQTVLGSYADKSITTIKSAVFNSILWKIIEAQFLVASAAFSECSLYEPKRFLTALSVIFGEILNQFDNLPARIKRKVLKATVYFSFFYVFLQLALCVWTLSWGYVPLGLGFLLVCATIVSFLNFQCLRFVIVQEILKQDEKETRRVSTHVSRGYVRTRDILGKRTISHVNLF